MTRTKRIAARFDAAAPTYGEAALVQRRVADALAAQILAANLMPGGRVLELGCGAGQLTARLAGPLQPALWIASDIAPAMLEVLGKAAPHPAVRRLLTDAQAPAVRPGFDLVCSSLTLQWLADPQAAIARWRALVSPDGVLAFSTLIEGSFAEWRKALIAAGAAEPGPPMASLEQLRAWAPGARIEILDLHERHVDGIAFLRAARQAGVDVGLGRPLSGGTMRRALRGFEAAGGAVTYRAAIVCMQL
jgi:malonyl-CoA O-methyltransferase